MKSITVDIDDKMFEELNIDSEHISFEKLRFKILAHEIREDRKKLQQLVEEYGLDKLTEEEIFEEVERAKQELRGERR